MKTIKILTAAIVAIVFFAGCLGDPVTPEAQATYIAVIVNNGNNQNGSVNYYNEETDKISTEPFEYKLDATYRSIQLVDDRLCLVTNDPDAIVHFDVLGRIIGAPRTYNIETPRFLTATANYLFVSNWGAESGAGNYPNSFVSIFDKFDNSLVKKLDCGAKAEGIVAHKDRLFVATAAGVEVFNTQTSDFAREPTITASSLTGGAKQLLVDSLGNVWASYSGGGLLCIDPTSRTIVRELPNVPVDAETGAIAISKNGKKIISYVNSSPATVVVTDLATGNPTELIEGNYTITALGVSPFTDNIYIANTPSSGESTLLVFDERGTKKSEKQTGVHTGHITFFGYYYY
jgi:hypothetical protein